MIGGVLMFTASLLIAVVLLAMLHPTGRTPGCAGVPARTTRPGPPTFGSAGGRLPLAPATATGDSAATTPNAAMARYNA